MASKKMFRIKKIIRIKQFKGRKEGRRGKEGEGGKEGRKEREEREGRKEGSLTFSRHALHLVSARTCPKLCMLTGRKPSLVRPGGGLARPATATLVSPPHALPSVALSVNLSKT